MFDKLKELLLSDQPLEIKVVGMVTSRPYHNLKLLVELFHDRYPEQFAHVECVGYLELDWIQHVKALRQEVGAAMYVIDRPTMVVMDGVLVGTDVHFSDLLLVKYYVPSVVISRDVFSQVPVHNLIPYNPMVKFVHFILSSNGRPLGQIVIQVDEQKVPSIARQFLELCNNMSSHSLAGSKVYKVVRGGWFELGEGVVSKEVKIEEGSGPSHSYRGTVAFLVGPGERGPPSLFITFKAIPAFDKYYVPLGRVVIGERVLAAIEIIDLNQGTPLVDLRVDSCGVLPVGLTEDQITQYLVHMEGKLGESVRGRESAKEADKRRKRQLSEYMNEWNNAFKVLASNQLGLDEEDLHWIARAPLLAGTTKPPVRMPSTSEFLRPSSAESRMLDFQMKPYVGYEGIEDEWPTEKPEKRVVFEDRAKKKKPVKAGKPPILSPTCDFREDSSSNLHLFFHRLLDKLLEKLSENRALAQHPIEVLDTRDQSSAMLVLDRYVQGVYGMPSYVADLLIHTYEHLNEQQSRIFDCIATIFTRNTNWSKTVISGMMIQLVVACIPEEMLHKEWKDWVGREILGQLEEAIGAEIFSFVSTITRDLMDTVLGQVLPFSADEMDGVLAATAADMERLKDLAIVPEDDMFEAVLGTFDIVEGEGGVDVAPAEGDALPKQEPLEPHEFSPPAEDILPPTDSQTQTDASVLKQA